MTSKQIEQRARRLLSLGYNDSAASIARLAGDDLDGLRRALEGIAERAAWLAAYVDLRHGQGCGDQGHVRAVKWANKIAAIVWRTGFGYNAYQKVNPDEPKTH